MNKRNWISALLAVMMVISMMACIAVPVAAEEYTLPSDAVHIDTITERGTTGRNIYIETAKDFVTLATKHAGILLNINDVVYLKNDIDISTYEGTFSTDYVPMTYGKSGAFSIDGLGHSIKNWDAKGMFGQMKFEKNTSGDVYVKNLTFEDANIVNASGNTSLLFATINADNTASGSVLVENVHFVDCKLKNEAYNHYVAALVGRFQGTNITATVRNCSVIGCEFTVPGSEATQGNAFLIGRSELYSKLMIENCLIANNTVGNLVNAGTNTSGGMVVGDTKYVGNLEFKNIGVFDNTMKVPAGTANDAVLVRNYNAAVPITATGIYAAGNVLVTDAGSEPISTLVLDTKGNGVVSVSDYVVDDVAYVLYDSTAAGDCVTSTVNADYTQFAGVLDLNKNASYPGWGFETTADGVDIVLVGDGEYAPAKVTFDNSATYYTDINGKLKVVADENGKPALADTAEIEALSAYDWVDADLNAVDAGTDWTAKVITADAAYTKVTLPPFTVSFDKTDVKKGDIITATVALRADEVLDSLTVGLKLENMSYVEDSFKNVSGLGTPANLEGYDLSYIVVGTDGEAFADAATLFTVQLKVTSDVASLAEEASLEVELVQATTPTDNGDGTFGDPEDVTANYTQKSVAANAAIDNPEVQDSYYDGLTAAGSASTTDDATAYKISNVDELIAASNNAANFTADDVIYITNDLDIPAWEAETGKTFGTEFTNFNTTITFTMDGLGHTITGYTDDIAFFGSQFNGTLRHVTFKDSTVTRTSGTKSAGCSLLAMQTTAAVEYDDVHLVNCHVDFTYSHTSNADGFSGLFVGRVLTGATALTIRSCTVTDSSVHVSRPEGNATGLTDVGILAGRIYPVTVTVENVIVKDSGVQFPIDVAAHADGMLIGQIYDGTTKNIYFNNIGVFGCTFDVDTFSNEYPFAIITNFRSAASGALKTFDNIYVYGNTYSYLTDASDSASRTTLPMDTVIHQRSGSTMSKRNPSNIKTDANVVYALNFAANTTVDGVLPGTNESKSAKVADEDKIFTGAATDYATAIGLLDDTTTFDHWNYNEDGTVDHLGQKVTFTEAGVSEVYYTSRLNEHVLYEETDNGLVAVDQTLFADLATELWYDAALANPTYEDFIKTGYAWADETYPVDKEYVRVPYASEATRNDNLSVYVIDSVSELIKTNMALKLRGYNVNGGYGVANNAMEDCTKDDTRYVVWNFEATDTIYITNDLDMTDWDTTELATYDPATGYTPEYLPYMYNAAGNGTGAKDTRGSVSYELNNGTVDFDNDGTVEAVYSYATKQDLFAALYCGLASGYSAGLGYATLQTNIDGMNHTIKNYKGAQPFVMAMNGIISNLTFDTASVTTEAWAPAAPAYTQAAIVVGTTQQMAKTSGIMDGVIIDNVHIKNAVLTANDGIKSDGKSVTANAGLFLAGVGNSGNRNLTLKNSSAVDSKIISNIIQDANTDAIGLATGYVRYTANIENCIFDGCTIESADALHHPIGLVGGNNNADYYGAYLGTYNNISVVDCKLVAPGATSADVSLIQSATDYANGRGIVIHNIFASGNTVVPVTDGVLGEAAPITDVLAFYNASNDYNEAHDYSNIVTDAAVTYFMNDYLTDENDVLITDQSLQAGIDAAVAGMNAVSGTAEWYKDTNGNYVPAHAQVGTDVSGYVRYELGRHDIAKVLDEAGDATVRVLGDQTASDVVVSAGQTLELDGSVLDATVAAFGTISDATNGLGGVTAFDSIESTNVQIPLYDADATCYRLVQYGFTNPKKAAAINGIPNAMKFRSKLQFLNDDGSVNTIAYALLGDSKLGYTATITDANGLIEGGLPVVFDAETLGGYGDAIVASGKTNYSLTLNIYGMDAVEDDELSIVYTITSCGTTFYTSEAETYTYNNVPDAEA